MNFILKIALFFQFLLLSHFNYSQNYTKGKVIDSDSGAALTGVIIKNINDSTKVYTSKNGTFQTNESGLYTFIKKGYHSAVFKILEKEFNIIQLVINPSELNAVVINVNYHPKALKESTSSINIITAKDIERGNNVEMSLVLNRVPGVFMQSGALNTNRITIRGIGARNLFGTAKIRAYFKDIPLTNVSGATNIEDFELGALSRFEIIKGASSIYGAGLGGTIQLTPQNAYLNQANMDNDLLVGAFGLMKGIIKLNYGDHKNGLNAVYSNTHSDGYRDNNQYDRQTLTINTNHYLNKNDELSILATYVNLKAFIPSSINENDFLNNPKTAAFTWGQAKGFEDSERGLLGVSWQHDYTKKLKQYTSVFTSFRNGYEPRPFNILADNTFAFGFRARLIGQTKLLNKNLNWTFGGETFKDFYTSKTFENLYQDFPPGNGSVQGNKLSDFKENRRYFNVFLETNYNLTQTTILSFGLNYNKTAYNLKDNFDVTDANPNQSGAFQFKGIISPKLGIVQELSKSIQLYSNASHGFSPITLEETLLPNGQINTNLNPETGWNFEIGSRGAFLNNRLQFDASIFRLSIKNLLVSRRTAQDQFIGINAGKTQHDGLELNMNYIWLKKEKLSLNSFVNYTLNNFIFKEFIDDTNNFSRNDLTGVPASVFNSGIDINTQTGIYGNINFQYVGSMPITDANSLYSKSYNLTNIKTGYKTNLNKKLKLNMFFGINNIFDVAYASQILINATSFGNSAPRYYYPGNPVNYYTGININYTF